MLSAKKSRSIRSLAQLMRSPSSDINAGSVEDGLPPQSPSLHLPSISTLHLPPSLSPETLSPTLWSFVHAYPSGHVDSDVLSLAGGQTLLAVSTPDGVELNPVPLHLKDPEAWKTAASSKRKNIRHVFGTEQRKSRKYVIELKDIKMKSSTGAQAAVCKLQIGYQRTSTGVIHLRKEGSKGLGLTSKIAEGFVFDASEEGHEMRIQIRVHAVATARNDAVSASPSMDNMVGAEARSRLSLLSSLRRSPTSGSMHHSQSITGLNTSGGQLPASGASTPTSVRAPVAASMEGQLLAEALLAVPVQNGMKSTQEYSLTNLKGKEIAKLTICAGALIDEEFRAVPPEPVPVEPKFADFLNFSLSTPGASVWRKYWCVLRDHEILVFDFEYQEKKPEVARIPLASLQTLHPSDPELMCAANCIEFVFAPATVSTPWLDTVITVRPYTGELAGYATADSSKRMTDWIDRIAREKARLGPTQQPVPPPRKLANGGKSLGKHVGSNMPGMMVGLNKNSSLRKPVASVGSVALAREVGY